MTQGFKLVQRVQTKHPAGTASIYHHQKTGARILSIQTQDKNKVFTIAFRTPPTDNTGVAHILEHSVLCGSKKYPLKEPFVELLKSSLQTFLNAMTYPDKTCYPVASTNLKDFYNLIEVYLDAVFFPLLHPYTFAQEGWHYELNSLDDELKIKGVVYNEMKGAYSSPDNLLGELSQQSLFSGHTYGLDSGGKPEEIVNLNYEQFLAFHQKYYHPANSWICFYGDDPEEKRLEILASYLEQFERIDVNSKVPDFTPRQLNFQKFTLPYAATSPQDKPMFTLNWFLGEPQNIGERFAWMVLNLILIGLPGSPLRKRLIESGLGEDLAGIGLETDLRYFYFSTGLRGILEKDIPFAEKIILETLQELSEHMEPDLVEASLNLLEFRIRENNTGSFPQGLSVILRALTGWIYDHSPLDIFELDEIFQELRTKTAQGYLQKLITRGFMQNKHTTKVVLLPDQGLTERQAQLEKQKLDQTKQSMTSAQLEKIVLQTQELQEFQRRQDKPEDLAKLPRLKLTDLNPKTEDFWAEKFSLHGIDAFQSILPTNGVIYLDLGFNLQGLNQQELVMTKVLARMLLEMDTKKRDYAQLGTLIAKHTGGIRSSFFIDQHLDSEDLVLFFWLRSKVLPVHLAKLQSLLAEILLEYDFSDSKRLQEILLEEKAGLEASFIPMGHSYVIHRLRAGLGPKGQVEEILSGLSYYFAIKQLLARLKQEPEKLLAEFSSLAQKILSKNNLLIHYTAEAQSGSNLEKMLQSLLALLPQGQSNTSPLELNLKIVDEGIKVSAQVNYVGKGYKLKQKFLGGTGLVASNLLRSGYLWEKIRVLGGAYGAFCLPDLFRGEFYFCSYRDPNHLTTLNTYDQAGNFLTKLKLSSTELEKIIISTVGSFEPHQLPDSKGFESVCRQLKGLTPDKRQQIKDQILKTRLDDLQKLGEGLSQADKNITVILGPEESLHNLYQQGILARIIKLNS